MVLLGVLLVHPLQATVFSKQVGRAVLGGWAKVSVPQGEGQPCGPRRPPSQSLVATEFSFSFSRKLFQSRYVPVGVNIRGS